jgi:hypothetical protein
VRSANALRWDGGPGHYEVYYLTFTDPASETGVWIRYTMLAPLEGAPTCSLWFLTMSPREGLTARKATFSSAELTAEADPFRLTIASATLADGGASGEFEDVSWSLQWEPGRSYDPVEPLLRPFASTVFALPNGDTAISGRIGVGSQSLSVEGARGAQAHLWGSKHAAAWAWARCGDFRTADGERVADTFIDGVSARVHRFGREVGPATPVVGRIDGEDFRSTSLPRLLSNRSDFAPGRWRFEAVAKRRKLIGEVDADTRLLAGVTYHDPDGEPAYCYNSEAASMRLHVYRRSSPGPGWTYARTLFGAGCAHFEYAQRDPVPDLELLLA